MANEIIRKQIMFYVQHLLGIGHMERALRLSGYLQEAGMDVTIVSGGMPYTYASARGGNLIQLAPVRAADAEFSQLLDHAGQPVTDVWRERRSAALLRAFEDGAPDALMIEMFPFGRRQFRFELLPLLQAARARRPSPLILSSVRDILVPSASPGRTEDAIAHAQEYFDHILVHGDAGFIRLDESYPAIAKVSAKITYTGYVTASAAVGRENLAGSNEVIISAGGGAVGEALLSAALAARARSKQAGHLLWRVLVGGNAPEGQLQTLRMRSPEGVVVEAARADFPQMLFNCTCSVSQAGYNTVMDILRAKASANTPAVIVPFATAREQEQTIRARALARTGLAVLLAHSHLSPASLAASVDQAIMEKTRPHHLPDMNGGITTARILREKLDD